MNNSFQKRSKCVSKCVCNVTHIVPGGAVVVLLLLDPRRTVVPSLRTLCCVVAVVTVAPFVGAFLCRNSSSRSGGLGFGTLLLELLLAGFLFPLLGNQVF
jgi:hypothetical protein